MTDRPAGRQPVVHETIDSTNAEARRLSDAGETGPLWIAARRQSAGRGRQGRDWSSEPGNLAATLLFSFDGSYGDAAKLSFATALAVADVFGALAPDTEVTLKWPNDVLVNRRKAAGILLENFGPDADGRLRLAIGIGLNLAHYPPAEAANWPPTSIANETGEAPAFDGALMMLAQRLDHWLETAATAGFAKIRRRWLARAINLGGEIEVRLPTTTLTGRFEDLDMDGTLVLDGPAGRQRIAAGDVFFAGGA